MRLPIVVHLVGVVLRMFGLMFAVPLGTALLYREHVDAIGFTVAGVATVVTGHVMRWAGGRHHDDIRRLEALAIVAGTWLAVAIAAAVPYVWSGFGLVDALFESMSGLTTTGATIVTDFSRVSRSLFLWRSLTQWLGGMGVIALFIAVLPRLAIAGRQLFFAEAPGPTNEKLTPQVRKTAAVLWKLYAAISVAEVAALVLSGMPLYDSVCHAMTTLAAGGFSPHPESVMGYANPAAEWIITFFMFVAGANFALQYRALRGQPTALAGDDEFRAYAGVVLVSSGLLAVFLWQDGYRAAESVRHAAFQVVSIVTTTGYASVDFARWTEQSKMVLFALMFVGGCAGSAGGGPKVVRLLLVSRYLRSELRRTLHPRAVLPVKLNGGLVPDDVMRAVLAFFLLYLLVFAVSALVVVLLGADIITGLTATIACLGNIGPGLNMVGPMGNFAHLHPVSRLVLTAAMWIGRLEVVTVLALLRPEVWRSVRWHH
jgi:trk system potassium uptake protein TrkH